MSIFWRFGNKPAQDALQTNRCAPHCQPAGATIKSRRGFDSERDALVAWQLFRGHIVATWGKNAWDSIWGQFACTNGQCPNKKPCANAPVYVEAGSELFRLRPGAPQQWRLYLRVVREIQCVPAGDGGPRDEEPRLPDPEPREQEPEDEGMQRYRELALTPTPKLDVTYEGYEIDEASLDETGPASAK